MIFSILSTASLLSLGVNAQGSWNRRAYYNDHSCKAAFVHGYQVFYPNTPCAKTTLVNFNCEVKSRTEPISSEGTSCESVQSNNAITDGAWFPSVPEERTRLPGNPDYIMVCLQYLNF